MLLYACSPSVAATIPNYRLSPHGGAVQADGITSANTVGYTSREVKAGQFYMVGVQFADVSAKADVANFNNFFATTCAPGEYGDGNDASMNNAPQIQVLNASGIGYTKYYYINDAVDAEENPVPGNCWANQDGFIATNSDALDLAKGFWFKSMTDGTVNCSGQVSATGDRGRTIIADQFNIVANAYPVALSLNSAESTDFTPGEYGDGNDASMNNAPQIQVLNASGVGYTKYYYISDAVDAEENPVSGNCWVNQDGYMATGTQVPVGQSFWVKSASAGTFTFSL